MKWLTSLYPHVEAVLKEAVPDYWPGLKMVVDAWFDGRFNNHVALSLAACKAVGGNPVAAVPAASALLAAGLSVRILDDLQDKDKSDALWQSIGPERANNFAFVTQSLVFRILEGANYPPEIGSQLRRLFLDGMVRTAAGQDRDLSGLVRTPEDYWTTTDLKTSSGFATAALLGGHIGSQDPAHWQVLRDYGYHFGRAVQVFNDYEGVWQADPGQSDFHRGKVNLALVYGLNYEHPRKQWLQEIVSQGQLAGHADEVIGILSELETRKYLVWRALQERNKAVQLVRKLPDEEGQKALDALFTGMFGDLEAMTTPSPLS